MLRFRIVGSSLLRCTFLAVSIMLGSGLPVLPQEGTPSEYAIKAAMIHKFAGFITWPNQSFQSPSDPVILTVLGSDPFGSQLEDMMQGNMLNGRRIVVQRVRDERHLTACHILFIAGSEQHRLPEILERIQGQALLTIGDSEGFCEHGGIVNFYREANHIRFQINPAAAERENIKISSQLLKLARIVKENPAIEGI
jgi:hypothetical protein